MSSLQWRSDFLLPALFLAAIREAQWRRTPMRYLQGETQAERLAGARAFSVVEIGFRFGTMPYASDRFGANIHRSQVLRPAPGVATMPRGYRLHLFCKHRDFAQWIVREDLDLPIAEVYKTRFPIECPTHGVHEVTPFEVVPKRGPEDFQL
jgi:hypothetical protein